MHVLIKLVNTNEDGRQGISSTQFLTVDPSNLVTSSPREEKEVALAMVKRLGNMNFTPYLNDELQEIVDKVQAILDQHPEFESTNDEE
jgi:hypothetical protein